MEQAIDTEFLLNSRRNAFVECSMHFMEHNNVVAYFGENIPLAVLYGYGLIAVPLEDIDTEIFQFTSAELRNGGFCDCITSTLTYLETDKCPILFSAKAYLFSNACERLFTEFSARTEKPCIRFNATSFQTAQREAELKSALRDIADTDFDEAAYKKAYNDLAYIDSVLEKIAAYSDATALELFLLRFYSPYITNLTERVRYFETLEKTIRFKTERRERPLFTAACPRGAFKSIAAQVPENALIMWQCPHEAAALERFDFADAACTFQHVHECRYERGLHNK